MMEHVDSANKINEEVKTMATEKKARPKLKQWTITTGQCGPISLHSKVIKAYTKEEAVKKFVATLDEKKTESEIAWYIDQCYEHIPEPRKKAE